MSNQQTRTPRTLRLGDEASAALAHVVSVEKLPANTVIERAIIEYETRRRETRDTVLRRIVTENADLLARLD